MKHLKKLSIFLWFNVFPITVLVVLSLYAKVGEKGEGIRRLFSEPFDPWYPYAGLFTGVSDILWCLSFGVCAFSFWVLQKAKPRLETLHFLLASTLFISLLFIDDRFRVHILLEGFVGIPKTTTYTGYGIMAIAYIIAFWTYFKKSDSLPLVIAVFFFILSSVIDLIHVSGGGKQAMLEDGTKLIGNLNLAIYYWRVCYQEIWRRFVDRTPTV